MGAGEIIGGLLFWGGLIMLAFWLVNLLFPAAPQHDDPNKKSGETRISPHDKSMF